MECKQCLCDKTLEEFGRAKTKLGRKRVCRSCASKNQRLRYASDPAVREAVRAYNLVRKRREPHEQANATLRMKYGITLAEYEILAEVQNQVCAICKRPQMNGSRLAVDHDHRTGKIRGLLCRKCNFALGYLNDDPSLADKAAAYLRERSSPT